MAATDDTKTTSNKNDDGQVKTAATGDTTLLGATEGSSTDADRVKRFEDINEDHVAAAAEDGIEAVQFPVHKPELPRPLREEGRVADDRLKEEKIIERETLAENDAYIAAHGPANPIRNRIPETYE